MLLDIFALEPKFSVGLTPRGALGACFSGPKKWIKIERYLRILEMIKWWKMMKNDDKWWKMMKNDGKWWKMTKNDEKWWKMMIHELKSVVTGSTAESETNSSSEGTARSSVLKSHPGSKKPWSPANSCQFTISVKPLMSTPDETKPWFIN